MDIINRLEDLPHGCPRPVATVGNFDGIHLGHQQLIRFLVGRAREIGGTATVITFNPHPLAVLAPNNAPRQIQTLDQKLDRMRALGIRLAIVIPFSIQFAQTKAREFVTEYLWRRFQLHEIYVGPNFAFGHRREGSFNLLKEVGAEKGFFVGKVHQVQFRGARVSSTSVRQALVAGQVALARRLLARPFALTGEIVHGSALGAGMSIPTANLHHDNELVPRNGVYVTMLSVEGRRCRSVSNVGIRPTITAGKSDPVVSIETHVLDFDAELYGARVSLEFLVHLREEKRFPSNEVLVAQITRDIAKARRYFDWLERCAPALLSPPGAV
jgi:riboflavin kinase/FMN adenylyltransferase